MAYLALVLEQYRHYICNIMFQMILKLKIRFWTLTQLSIFFMRKLLSLSLSIAPIRYHHMTKKSLT